jgi:hypothetical protein
VIAAPRLSRSSDQSNSQNIIAFSPLATGIGHLVAPAPDSTAVVPLMHDIEPQARAFAHCFGSEERIESWLWIFGAMPDRLSITSSKAEIVLARRADPQLALSSLQRH